MSVGATQYRPPDGSIDDGWTILRIFCMFKNSRSVETSESSSGISAVVLGELERNEKGLKKRVERAQECGGGENVECGVERGWGERGNKVKKIVVRMRPKGRWSPKKN